MLTVPPHLSCSHKSLVLQGPGEVPPAGVQRWGPCEPWLASGWPPSRGMPFIQDSHSRGWTQSPSSHVDGIALSLHWRARTPSFQHKGMDKPRRKTCQGRGRSLGHGWWRAAASHHNDPGVSWAFMSWKSGTARGPKRALGTLGVLG